tara:strand:- start:1617 stop:2462 length:846 start_codon:yes stop_codon:yes gene_type:complete
MLGYELSSLKERFQIAGLDSPSLDAELIISFVLGIPRSSIYAFPERIISFVEIASIEDLVGRREKHEPMAYILGEKEFWSINFAVDKNIFIPRPETELLVELSIKNLDRIEFPVILDIGSGSGAIGVSIAKELKNSRVFASDLSKKATVCSMQNASSFSLENYSVLQTFMMSGILEKNIFNLIVSNPPYIPTCEIANLDSEVANYGPSMALDGGKNGMFYLSEIISKAPSYLFSEGVLLLEIDHKQAEICIREINSSGKYSTPVIHKDLAGLKRVVEVKKN